MPSPAVLSASIPLFRAPRAGAPARAARRQPLPVLLAALLQLGLLLALLLGGRGARAADLADVLLLSEAVAVRADTERFPDQVAPRTAQLPEVWDRALQGDGPVWYRLSFQLRQHDEDQLLNVYLEQVCSTFDLRLNEHLIHSGQGNVGLLDRPCTRPALLSLPGALLQPGRNQLDIKVYGQPLQRMAIRQRAAALGVVRIGTPQQLWPLYRTQRLLNGSLSLLLASAVGVVGLVALVLALLARLPYMAYYGGAALGWALLLGLLGAELPLPPAWSEWLLGSAPSLVIVCGIMFLLRYCVVRLPWLDAMLWLQCLMVPLSLLIAMPERLHQAAQPWVLILLTELVAALLFFLWRAWVHSRHDFRIVGAATLALLLGLGLEQLLPGPQPLQGQHALSLALLVLFAGMGWRMLRVFRQALQSAEAARDELEQRIEQITLDVEQNYGQMAEQRIEQRIEQITAKERKRIAADLHDDLGAKLLTIVHTSESERIATLAREALEEMRLSVRGLAGRPVQLGDALGDWRSEVMGRLSQGGIELVWNIPDDLLMSERRMSSRAYVQTTRILREAVSNLLKHSGASHCEITVRINVHDFELTIMDNGKGIPMELDGKLDRGHGMSTMKTRAKQLQGQCLVESGPGFGTTIRLTLPL